MKTQPAAVSSTILVNLRLWFNNNNDCFPSDLWRMTFKFSSRGKLFFFVAACFKYSVYKLRIDIIAAKYL